MPDNIYALSKLEKRLSGCIRATWAKHPAFVVNDVTFTRMNVKEEGEQIATIIVYISPRDNAEVESTVHIPFMELGEDPGDERQSKWRRVLKRKETQTLRQLRHRTSMKTNPDRQSLPGAET